MLRTSGYLDCPPPRTPLPIWDDGDGADGLDQETREYRHSSGLGPTVGAEQAAGSSQLPVWKRHAVFPRPSSSNGVVEEDIRETVKVPRWTHVDPMLGPEEHGKMLAPAKKLELLRDREERWGRLDPRAKRRMTVHGPAGVYELQEGMFLICDDWEEDDTRKPRSIRLIPLPSAIDPQLDHPPVPLKEVKLPFPIGDLTMDPTQDLIVVAEHQEPDFQTGRAPERRYHLLSLHTAQPHPLAQMPILSFPAASNRHHHRSQQLLQIMGDVLIILVNRIGTGFWPGVGFPPFLMQLNHIGPSANEEEVVAWNWRTGKVLMRKILPDSGWTASMALLSPTLFMVTSTSDFSRPVNVAQSLQAEAASPAYFPPVIKIYSFLHGQENERDPIQPLAQDHMDDTTPRPILVAQLEMPAMGSDVIVSSFDVRPDPAFPVRSASDHSPRIGTGPPFTQDPSKGLLVFNFSVIEPATRETPLDAHAMFQNIIDRAVDFELFVLRETLVRLGLEGEERFRQVRVGAEAGYEHWRVERVIPWREWGERGSRLEYAAMERRQWVCFCSGYRYAALLEADDADGLAAEPAGGGHISARPSRVKIYDFSPCGVRREMIKLGLDLRLLETRHGDIADLLDAGEAGMEEQDQQTRLDELDVEDTIMELVQSEGGSLPRGSRFRRYDYWVTDRSEYDGLVPGDAFTEPAEESAAVASAHSIESTKAEGSDLPSQSRVGDFEMAEEERAPHRSHLVLEPSVIPRGEVWTEDVVTWLPYRSVTSEDTVLANGIMIDDQRVMVVDVSGCSRH